MQPPTFQLLTEPGLPGNELSLQSKFGLRVTNVYKGTGARLVVKGWNAGPNDPSGFDVDLTSLITDPLFASYYNETTKVLDWPVAEGWVMDRGGFFTGHALQPAGGGLDITISSYTSPLRVAVVARRELRSGQNGSSWIQRPRFHYHRSPGHFAASWTTSLGRGYSVYQLDG